MVIFKKKKQPKPANFRPGFFYLIKYPMINKIILPKKRNRRKRVLVMM